VCIKGRCAYVQLKGALSRVDELVASAFLSMPSTPGPHELVHLDGDPHNDRADNLQWMTLPEHRAFKADPTRASSQVYKHCPATATRDLLLQQARNKSALSMPPVPEGEELWVKLDAHRNAKGLCPSVSSWGSFRAAGKDSPHVWRGAAVRSVSLNARKYMLDRLVADTFVPKTDALADQLVHLDGDATNCRADNLAWHLHPSRDPGSAASAHYDGVEPALAECAAAYYRRKTGAPEPPAPPAPQSRADYLQWAQARSMHILAAAALRTL